MQVSTSIFVKSYAITPQGINKEDGKTIDISPKQATLLRMQARPCELLLTKILAKKSEICVALQDELFHESFTLMQQEKGMRDLSQLDIIENKLCRYNSERIQSRPNIQTENETDINTTETPTVPTVAPAKVTLVRVQKPTKIDKTKHTTQETTVDSKAICIVIGKMLNLYRQDKNLIFTKPYLNLWAKMDIMRSQADTATDLAIRSSVDQLPNKQYLTTFFKDLIYSEENNVEIIKQIFPIIQETENLISTFNELFRDLFCDTKPNLCRNKWVELIDCFYEQSELFRNIVCMQQSSFIFNKNQEGSGLLLVLFRNKNFPAFQKMLSYLNMDMQPQFIYKSRYYCLFKAILLQYENDSDIPYISALLENRCSTTLDFMPFRPDLCYVIESSLTNKKKTTLPRTGNDNLTVFDDINHSLILVVRQFCTRIDKNKVRDIDNKLLALLLSSCSPEVTDIIALLQCISGVIISTSNHEQRVFFTGKKTGVGLGSCIQFAQTESSALAQYDNETTPYQYEAGFLYYLTQTSSSTDKKRLDLAQLLLINLQNLCKNTSIEEWQAILSGLKDMALRETSQLEVTVLGSAAELAHIMILPQASLTHHEAALYLLHRKNAFQKEYGYQRAYHYLHMLSVIVPQQDWSILQTTSIYREIQAELAKANLNTSFPKPQIKLNTSTAPISRNVFSLFQTPIHPYARQIKEHLGNLLRNIQPYRKELLLLVMIWCCLDYFKQTNYCENQNNCR